MKNNILPLLNYYRLVTIHKIYVFYYMFKICNKLMLRAILHDCSKYNYSEAKGFLHLIAVFINAQYGTPEYYSILDKERDIINQHYKKNDHHPEHHNSINDMNIYQLLEMISDWKSSVKKNKNGNIKRSFDINEKRFNISPELLKILKTI